MMQQHHGAFRICDAQQEIIIACSTADTVNNRETVKIGGVTGSIQNGTHATLLVDMSAVASSLEQQSIKINIYH